MLTGYLIVWYEIRYPFFEVTIMNDSNKAKECLQRIVDLFKTGDIPKALAVATIPPQTNIPSAKWSVGNRILQFLADTSDARGFRQWQKVDRKVKKGAKAFCILGPNSKVIQETNDKQMAMISLYQYGARRYIWTSLNGNANFHECANITSCLHRKT